jgi:glyoxylate/hydroxypyruvate reductase A
MAVLLISEYGFDPHLLRDGLSTNEGAVEVRVWPDAGDPNGIEAIVTDVPVHHKASYRSFRRLRWVCFLGHGVGDVLNDPDLPADVFVSGLTDPDIIAGLTEYVIAAVTRHHMRHEEYAELQRRRQWCRLSVPPASTVTVAVLGLGRIGAHAARTLADIGFRVLGWSRSPKTIPGIASMHGDDALQHVLAQADQIVSILPETSRTRGLLNRDRLAKAKRGAFLINVGRGSAVVESDLLDLLDSGQIAGACLDVTVSEPLDPESPLWLHPKVVLTPHTGGAGGDGHKVEAIARDFQRVWRGVAPLNAANRERGY